MPAAPPTGPGAENAHGPGRGALREDGLDLVDRPVQLVAGDDERRGEADRVHVGVLAEEPAVLEGVAVLAGPARLGHELDAGPEAEAARLLHEGRADGLESGGEVDAQLRRPLDELLVDEDV